jgi:two-component system, LytTR family, response regulator
LTIEYSNIYNPQNMKRNQYLVNIPIGARQEAQPSEILLFEADVNYTTVHFTNGKKIIVAKTIKKFEECFKHHNFYRIHKTFLVNMAFVDCLSEPDKTLRLIDSREIAVSRRRFEDVRRMMLLKENQGFGGFYLI